MPQNENIPTYDAPTNRTQLWRGCILGSIAHAVMVAKYPDLSNEQSWDGSNYNIQDSAGSRGTVSFSEDSFFAAFFDKNSPNNPFKRRDSNNKIEKYLHGMPPELNKLAFEEALQYLLQELGGKAVPVITAAFWGQQSYAKAAEPWDSVFRHGAHLIRVPLMTIETALGEWNKLYEFSGAQSALVQNVYNRRIKDIGSAIHLDREEIETIRNLAGTSSGIEESQSSFSEIGIFF